jgi:hypothetical protein
MTVPPSVLADGPLKGPTLARLLEQSPEPLLGQLAGHFSRFPLLLEFLDVSESLGGFSIRPPAGHTRAGGPFFGAQKAAPDYV